MIQGLNIQDHSLLHFTDVQKQVMKMTTVVQQIDSVLKNILQSTQLNKLISSSIHKLFIASLNSVISTIKRFQLTKPQQPFNKDHAFSKISQCQQEDEEQSNNTIQIHSQVSQKPLFDSKESEESIENLVSKSRELIQENEYLTDKLKEAERHILIIEQANEGLLKQQSKKISKNYQTSRDFLQMGSKKQREQTKQTHILKQKIQRLKADLKETEGFVVKSNESFVRQLHNKDQKIWKLQRQIDSLRSKFTQNQSSKDQKDFYIKKLKQENFKLEVLSRNLKIAPMPSKPSKSYKEFQKLFRGKVATATSLDIQAALKQK